MSQADIALYASKNNGRGMVTVYEPQQGMQPHERSMMSLDEQWRMIKDNHLLLIARGVASPRVPEACNFWLLSLRLWTSEGDVMEEHAFRSGLNEPELIRALDRRVFHEFFRNHATAVAGKGLGIALPPFRRRIGQYPAGGRITRSADARADAEDACCIW